MIQFKTSSVCVFESALYRTTSTVVQTPDLILVVDPTWLPNEVAAIQHFVAAVRGKRPVYLLFTHSDYDHIIAYRAFSGASVIASQALIDNPDQESNIQQILKFDDEYYIRRPYPIEYPKVDFIIQHDKQILALGSTTFTFYLAPGHNSDGIFALVDWNDLPIWIAGDYLSNVEFPYIYYSSYEYERTLAKAEQIVNQNIIHILIPGHGDATMDQSEMKARIQGAYHYIHALRQALQAGNEFPTRQLFQSYGFPGIMQKYHDENVILLKRELNIL